MHGSLWLRYGNHVPKVAIEIPLQLWMQYRNYYVRKVAKKYHEEAELTCSCIVGMFWLWQFHCSLSDSLKEDEKMLRAVLHLDHVQENLAIVLLTSHMVCKRVLLASVKSYIYVCTYVCMRCVRFVNFANVST